MNHSNSSEERASCPCKRLPLCLSSFTAAEHGNFQALMRHVGGDNNNNNNKAIAERQDAYGNTPLHLAAQHGHVGATAMLLQANCRVNAQASGATPLHRAAFSGAVATMQLLINHKNNKKDDEGDYECSLMVPDSSFGDYMTPLHKAASGGRYLAVKLLLDTHQSRQSLRQALTARDAAGQTPLQVAMQKNRNATVERQSVARWDAVAGHTSADWEKCIQLLQLAQNKCPADAFDKINHSNDNTTVRTKPLLPGKHHRERSILIQEKQQPELFPEIPLSLSSSRSSRAVASCMVCPTTADGRCLTLSWQSQFWSALAQSTNQQLGQTTANSTTTDPTIMDDDSEYTVISRNDQDGEEGNNIEVMDNSKNSTTQNHEDVGDHEIMSNDESNKDDNVAAASSSTATLPSSSSSSSSPSLGRLCNSCHTQTFALYPSSSSGTGGLLVCKKCHRKGRRRR